MPQTKPQLIRGLTFSATTALVVGSVIGTGVFLKAAVMAQLVPIPLIVVGAWLGAGVLSIAGVLVYAELGALFPQAGGEYVYLREAYGNAVAFCYGWMRFVVGSTGVIAGMAVGFATFTSPFLGSSTVWVRHDFILFGQLVHWKFGSQQLVAVSAIIIVSAVNCVGVVFGGRIQTFLTVLKIIGIAVITIGVFTYSRSATWKHLTTSEGVGSWTGFSAFGTAMLSALWAYNGWNQVPMAAGEVRDPERSLPRALITGILIVTFLYLIVNVAYFFALPIGEILRSSSTKYPEALPVATKAAQTFLGARGVRLVSIVFIVSTLGALHSAVLSCARVPFAMARDGLFFKSIGMLSENTQIPMLSIVAQAIWSCVLAASGTFDQLTDYVMFASWIFYGLVTSSIFVFRRRRPEARRPYKTLGYPVVPIVFVVVSFWLVLNTLMTRPLESLTGLCLTFCGLPLYVHFRRRNSFNQPTT
jgi:APA family basic amino acid/polyamine antiporter